MQFITEKSGKINKQLYFYKIFEKKDNSFIFVGCWSGKNSKQAINNYLNSKEILL